MTSNGFIKDGRFLMVSSFYNNTREHILQTFNNAIKQTYKNWLLIVGDDFSEDGCKEMLKEEVRKVNHPNILYYDVKYKRELYLYQNFFKAINYDYYFDLDSDDILSDNLLEIYNNHFKKHTDIFSIFCDYDVISENGSLERISTVKNNEQKDYIGEFNNRNTSKYLGVWKDFHSWNMYGHARCFRKSERSRFPIDRNCKTSTDSFVLFSSLYEGNHLHLPRNLYKLVNRSVSDSSYMEAEDFKFYNNNALLAMDKYSDNPEYRVSDVYDDIWFETNALSNSAKKNKMNLISNINEKQLSKIRFLYQDKDITLNATDGDNLVVVWNKLGEEQRVSIMEFLSKNNYSYTIYNFLDNFDKTEEEMEKYFQEESKSFVGLMSKYLNGYSYFNYFRHIIINKNRQDC